MDTKNINQDQEYEEFQENNQDQFEEQIDNHFAGLAVPIESGVHLSMDSSNQQRRQNAHYSQTDQHALSNQSQASNRRQQEQQHSLHQPQQVAQPKLKLQQTQFQIRSRPNTQFMNQQQQMRPIIRSQLQTQPIVHRSRITINGRQPSPSRFFSDTPPIVVKTISPPKNTALGLSFGPGQGSLQIGQAEGLHSHLVRSRVISQIQRPPILELPSNVAKPQSITFIKSEQSIRQTVSIQNTNQSNRSIQGQPLRPSSRLPSPILRQKTPERRLSPVPIVTINNHQATLIHNPQQLKFQKTTIITPPHGNLPSMNINQNNNQIRKSYIETKQIVEQRKIKLSIYLQQFYQILSRSQVILESIRKEGLDHDDEEILGIVNLQNNVYRRFKEAKIAQNLPSNFDFVENRSRRQENSVTISKSDNEKGKQLQQTQIEDIKRLQQRLSLFEEQKKKMHDQVQHLHSQISQLQLQNQDLHQQISTISANNPIEQEANSELNSYQKTIQSQQAIIKRLEQQLIQTHNQPISQQSGSRNVDNSFSSSQFQAQQSKFMAIIDSKEAYINDLQAQIIRHKTQIKSLKQQLLRERNQRNTGFTDVQDIGSTGKVPSGSFQKYEKMLKERDQAIEVLKQRIFQIQEQSDTIAEQKDKRIKQLHEQIMTLSQQSQAQVQTQAQTQVQAPSNNNYEAIQKYKSQIEYLKQSLQQKQILMIRLQNERKSTYNFQKQIEHLKIENDNLIAEIDDREKQRVRTSYLIEELQEKTKKVQSQEEMMHMLEKLKEKQQEIIKLRQTVDLHLANIDGLESEVAHLKEGYRSLQEGLIQQRKQSSQKQSQYNQRLQQLTKKCEKSEKSHQQQTTKLKKLLSQHRNTIKSLQHPPPALTQPQQQQQVSSSASPTDFRLQYSKSQIKIFELENTIKQKQNKIKQLQNNMETLKLKINHTNTLSQNQVLANQEVEMLRKKIQEFQKKKTGGSLYRVRDWEAIGIFQHKIVYELKKENQQLRSMLSQKNNPTQYQPQHRHNQHQNLSQTQQNYLTTIQHRLSEFNKKLTQLIQSPYSGTSSHHHHSATLSKELYSLLQRQRSVMHKQYSRDVEILQARLVDLQRYCAMLEAEGQEEWGNTYLYSKTTRKIEEKGMAVEQLDYYKGKNKELEERVDVLLHLNKDLKERLQKYMKPQGQNNIQFYKQQLQKAEKRIKTLQATISQLTTQNNQILQKLHKKVPQNDNSEFQQQIHEKSLKIASLNQQISALQLDIQSLASHQKILESQIINYKTTISSLQQKLSANNQTNKNLNKNIQYLESEITKLKMSNQMLKAEVQRLKEKEINRNGVLESQAAGDRAKMSELMQQIRQLQVQIDNKEHQLTEKNEQINNLTSKISIVDNNYWKQVDKVSQLNQRIRELEIKISELQTLLNNSKAQLQKLQSQLTQKQYQNQQYRKSSQYSTTQQQKILSLQQQNETLKKQLQQCSTTNSRLQSKINSLQRQIQQLNRLIETLKRKILEAQSVNQAVAQQKKIVAYYMEMVRSVLLEVEVLIGEVQVVGGQSERVLGRTRQEIKRGLGACCYLVHD